MILGKRDVVNTGNEGVSDKSIEKVEDSCCVNVGVICDIVSVDPTTGRGVTLVETITVNDVTEGVSVSFTRKANDDVSC